MESQIANQLTQVHLAVMPDKRLCLCMCVFTRNSHTITQKSNANCLSLSIVSISQFLLTTLSPLLSFSNGSLCSYPRRLCLSAWVGVRLFVCLFVCLFVRSITQKRMIQKCSNLV